MALALVQQWVLLSLSWEQQQGLLLVHCWGGLSLVLQQALLRDQQWTGFCSTGLNVGTVSIPSIDV
ncbi:hypothetical protein [Serratia fonticola]|uniref:Uncharacterized protein n=1 Tax=Serratia fonticola TaxID=47917 RepID=A0AAE7EKL3_SERFO|nr:hypothetical protein [Serratia fonticola]QKJ60161.1 hypothetical protein G9399_19955 [Serratia fonticola]